MIYLLTLGWPWFAGAFALGAFIGFLTFSRAPDVPFSGRWVILLGAFALAAAAAVSRAALLAGRDGVLLDIGLLAGLAYAAGLPLGGALKSLGGPAERKKPRKLAPLPLAPRPASAPQPKEAPRAAAAPERAPVPSEAAPALETIATPVAELAPVADLAPVAEPPPVADLAPPVAEPMEPARGPANRDRKAIPGARPERLAVPRNGVADDLSRIKGIGPRSHEKLNALGVFHYDQIASWNLDNARWIGATIGAPGRVERDKWIQQARTLTGAGTDQ